MAVSDLCRALGLLEQRVSNAQLPLQLDILRLMNEIYIMNEKCVVLPIYIAQTRVLYVCFYSILCVKSNECIQVVHRGEVCTYTVYIRGCSVLQDVLPMYICVNMQEALFPPIPGEWTKGLGVLKSLKVTFNSSVFFYQETLRHQEPEGLPLGCQGRATSSFYATLV